MKNLRYFASIKPIKLNSKSESTYNIPHKDNSVKYRTFKISVRPLLADSELKNINEEFSNSS